MSATDPPGKNLRRGPGRRRHTTEESLTGVEPVTMAAMPGSPAEPTPHANSHLFGRGLLYVVVWSLQLFAGTIVSPILAYVLGPTEFGSLASAIALHQVLTVLALLGLDQALVLHRAESGDDRSARGLVTVGILLAMSITLIVGVTGPLWSPALGFGHFSSLVVATILWTAPGAGVQVILSLLLAEDRLRPFTLISGISAVGGQVVGIALLLFVHKDANTYAWGGVVSQFGAMFIGIAVTRPGFRGFVRWPVVWRAIKLGVPLAMSGLAFFVLNAGDRIVIQRFLGAAEVGRYQVAYTVGYVVVLLVSFTGSAWTPRFAAVGTDEARWKLSTQSRDELYRLLVPMILGITLAAPIALRVVAPPTFRPQTLLVVVFLVAMAAFPVAASGATGRVMVISRRGKALAIIAGIAAAVNVGLNILLVPWIGIAGSAMATFLAFGLLAVLQKQALPKPTVWAKPSPSLVVSIAAALVVAGTSVLLPQSDFWNITRLTIALACLPWFLVRLRRARRGPQDPPDVAASEQISDPVVRVWDSGADGQVT